MASEEVANPARLLYGDAIRVFGSIAVVVLHIAAKGVGKFGAISPLDWWVYNCLDSACRWAVPAFVMLSGALLLNPQTVETMQTFYRKRVKRVGYPLLFWSAVYIVLANRGLPPLGLLKTAVNLMAFGYPYYHLYFLFVLMGLYVFVPLFRVVAKHTDESHLRGFAILGLLMASGDSLLRALHGVGLNSFSLFVPYVAYFFLGFALKNATLCRTRARACWLALVVCVGATALGTGAMIRQWGANERGLWLYDYFSPTVIVMSICVFLLFITASSKSQNHRFFSSPALAAWSKTTLGIYLIHPLFLEFLQKKGLAPGAHGAAVHLILAVPLILTLSWLATLLIQRIAPLRVVTG